MADAVGIDGLHSISGNCDLCGHLVDPSSQELNILGCTFSDCNGVAYHQDCLEKYLKSIRLERNRKTGFKCPRGCGKGTAFKEPCPGRIDKSHPIHPRSEESKKRRKAKLPEPAAPKPLPSKKEKGKDLKDDDMPRTKVADKAKDKCNMQQAWPIPVLAKAVAARKQENPSKEKLAELRDQARREIGIIANKDSGRDKSGEVASSARPVPATTKQPLASAWGRAGSSSLLSTSNGSSCSPLIPSHHLSVDSSTPRSISTPSPVLKYPSHPSQATTTPHHVPSHSQQQPQQKECHKQQQQQQPSNGHHSIGQHVRLGSVSHPALVIPTPSPSSSVHRMPPPVHPATLTPSSSLPPPSPHQVVPVGMEYTEGEDTSKLTKAQKKNLKRAERKKKQLASETASLQSSEQESLAQAEHDTLLFDMFIQALVSHKVLYSLQQLQQLGFPKWACVAAVKRFGCQLEDAVSWLLEEEFDDPDGVLRSVADACPAIDIEEELQELHELQNLCGISAAVIQEAILENHGDVQKTLSALVDMTDVTSVNGSQPSLSHAASCLSVQNGLFAYSLSNDSGDDASELHGHFTQESNSLLDVLLEPSEPSLTPTACCGQPQDLHSTSQNHTRHFSNGGSASLYHDQQLSSWPGAANGGLTSSHAGSAASGLESSAAAAVSNSARDMDTCWHPLMGPTFLGLGSRQSQGRSSMDGLGLSLSSPASGGLGNGGLLSDLLISPSTGAGQLPHVSLFQHTSEYNTIDDVGIRGPYDMWAGRGQSQQHMHAAQQQASRRMQLGGFQYDVKLDAYDTVVGNDAGLWMSSLLGELTPSNSIPSAALKAAATVPGDDHTGPATDEHEFNALMACLCSSMA